MKHYKRRLLLNFLFIFSIAVFNLSMSSGIDEFGILDDVDIEIFENQKGPALNTALNEEPYMESYNEWLCFPAKSTQFHCLDSDDYKDYYEFEPEESLARGYYPNITVRYQNKLYFIEYPDLQDLEECLEQIDVWKKLTENQIGLCVFAAKWPPKELSDPDEEYEFWTTYGLKTHIGRFMAPIHDPDYQSNPSDLENND